MERSRSLTLEPSTASKTASFARVASLSISMRSWNEMVVRSLFGARTTSRATVLLLSHWTSSGTFSSELRRTFSLGRSLVRANRPPCAQRPGSGPEGSDAAAIRWQKEPGGGRASRAGPLLPLSMAGQRSAPRPETRQSLSW